MAFRRLLLKKKKLYKCFLLVFSSHLYATAYNVKDSPSDLKFKILNAHEHIIWLSANPLPHEMISSIIHMYYLEKSIEIYTSPEHFLSVNRLLAQHAHIHKLSIPLTQKDSSLLIVDNFAYWVKKEPNSTYKLKKASLLESFIFWQEQKEFNMKLKQTQSDSQDNTFQPNMITQLPKWPKWKKSL
jgi:hypothetical protein